jgi:hypothetical protein
MIKKVAKYIGLPFIMFFINWLGVIVLDWGTIFIFAYLLDYFGIPFEYIGYLTTILLVVIDYFLLCFLYKNTKITLRLFGIFIVFIINELSLIAADKLIRSDDAFAILEGSKIITNSLILLLLVVIVSSILSAKKNNV